MKSPAEIVIHKCGGVAAVARIVERSPSRIRRWTYPKARGGTGGLIPAECQVALLAASRELGLGIEPGDFFPPLREAS